MSIAVQWVDQGKTIMHYRLDGKWDWNDYETALERGFTMFEKFPYAVDVLLDFTKSASLPDGALITWKCMMEALPGNTGRVAFVGGNSAIRTAVRMFQGINKNMKHRIVVTDTLDQVLRLLTQHRPTQTTVLVIEDEAALREEIVDMLQFEGYQTVSASNGIAGLAEAKKCTPDLILCDIAMPQMDGYGVLMELRRTATTALIPFIFITARADRASMRHGMGLGADDYVTKPFTNSELLAAVKTRLERSLQRPDNLTTVE